MPNPSSTATALRNVLISRGWKPSNDFGKFDTENATALHKQFFTRGPRLVESRDVSQQAHSLWELEFQGAWYPTTQGDPDRMAFDLADEVAAIHAAMSTNTTVLQDAFEFASSDPTYNEDTRVLEVLMRVQFWVSRSVAA